MENKKEEIKVTQSIEVSDELRTYLNTKLLLKEKLTDPIYEEDIDGLIKKFQKINKERTNEIAISANIVDEFINLIKNKLKEKKVDLGILEIDIRNTKFAIKEFVERTKDLSYSLRFKINSLSDINMEERDFLESRYGITYIYTNNKYHIDELYSIMTKMKTLLADNEASITIREKNAQRAQQIANIVFKNIKLYVPGEYRLEEKEIMLRNGEILPLPNFRVLEDTSRFAKLTNVFNQKIADYNGMRKLCKECLRLDGYDVLERNSVIGDFINSEVVIDEIDYGIEITKDGIKIIPMSEVIEREKNQG